MDFVERWSGGRQRFDFAALLKFTDLDPRVQDHLKRVYATLACALLVASLGALTHLHFHIGGPFSFIGALVSIIWLLRTPDTSTTLHKRYALLCGAAFFEGCSLGPLVQAVINVNPGLILTAFLGTSAVFFCFSGAALLSNRRTFIYLGGFLSSSIACLIVLRLCDVLFGGSSKMVYSMEVYGGLVIFLLYILFDTQMIVEKAAAGNEDYVKAALDLFIDFVAVFVRITVIMLNNAEKRDKKRK